MNHDLRQPHPHTTPIETYRSRKNHIEMASLPQAGRCDEYWEVRRSVERLKSCDEGLADMLEPSSQNHRVTMRHSRRLKEDVGEHNAAA